MTHNVNVANRRPGMWPHDQVLHAWWVLPGRLLAGEYPGSLDPAKSVQKRQALLDGGVDSIVDLTEAGERAGGGKRLEPYADLLAADAAARNLHPPAHVRHPIRDTGVIDDAGYDQIVGHIDAELAAGRVVYVHCWGGKGRTGTVAGCWLIDHESVGYPEVLHRMQELRRGSRKASHRVPDTDEQSDVLRRRATRPEGRR